LSHTSNPFCSGYFEDGIFKLFVQTGLELWSSWPQAPKEVGIQVWAISHQHPALLFFIPTWARYLKFFSILLLFLFFEAKSHSVAQAGFRLLILLPQSPNC
jgi:hypothetical protein